MTQLREGGPSTRHRPARAGYAATSILKQTRVTWSLARQLVRCESLTMQLRYAGLSKGLPGCFPCRFPSVICPRFDTGAWNGAVDAGSHLLKGSTKLLFSPGSVFGP
jgi:hypothetical protein